MTPAQLAGRAGTLPPDAALSAVAELREGLRRFARRPDPLETPGSYAGAMLTTCADQDGHARPEDLRASLRGLSEMMDQDPPPPFVHGR